MEPRDKNHLDELFQDKFSELEIKPESTAWPAVEERLLHYRRRRKAAFWRWTATAAAILISFYTGYHWRQFENTSEKTTPPISIQENSKANKTNDFLQQDNPVAHEQPDTEAKERPFSPEKKADHYTAEKPVELVSIPAERSESRPSAAGRQGPVMLAHKAKPAIAQPLQAAQPLWLFSAPLDEVETEDESYTLTQAYLPTNEELRDQEKMRQSDGLRLGLAASPTLAFSQSELNTTDAVTAANASNDQVANSFTAGIETYFRGKSRWVLEAGIFMNQWNQSNDRLVAEMPPGTVVTSNISTFSNNSTANLQFNNQTINGQETLTINNGEIQLIPSLDESYTFLELPLGLSYYLLDQKTWGWRIKAGISPRFLTASSVQLNYEDGSSESVENLSLKTFSIQLLVGTGVEYRLNSKLYLNITPALQYGLTPVNQHAVVDTYFHQFLIYSGLSFKL